MLFVGLGVLLLLLKLLELGPVAQWGWLWVLMPFGLALLWWFIADTTGLTQKREMRRLDDRKEQRRKKQLDALGLGPGAPKRPPRQTPPPDAP